jgi:predicted CoA-binding protein
MSKLKQIQDFLGCKRLAVIGVSRDPKDFTRSLFDELRRREYDAVPVNPEAGEVDGRRCYAHVAEIAPPVEAALLLTSPAVTERVVRECHAAGIRRIWMYRAAGAGAVSPGAVEFCEAAGMPVVAGECPFMFLPAAAWIHRLHGFCRKVTGRYPN